jgi:hypothetical protein
LQEVFQAPFTIHWSLVQALLSLQVMFCWEQVPAPTVLEHWIGLQKLVVLHRPVPQGAQPVEMTAFTQTPFEQESAVQGFPSLQSKGV